MMKINEKYKILGTNYSHRPDLQPEGTIVKCVEDKGNGFFIIRLIDSCDKKIETGVYGWLINVDKISYEKI